jgi:hypothetical protein
MNPGEVLSTNQEGATTAFYSQSHALVRFLREDDYGRRLRQYHKLLLDGLTGTWPIDEANKRIAADRNIPLTVKWNRTVARQLFEHYISILRLLSKSGVPRAPQVRHRSQDTRHKTQNLRHRRRVARLVTDYG